MDKFITGLIALVIGVVGGIFLHAPQTPAPGAVSSPDQYVFTHFYDNVNIGGYDFATTSIGTVTYTAASIVRSHVIEHQASAAVTASLPTNAALSAAGFLPNVGDTQTLFIHASTTKITLAGGTGVTLYSASSTKEIAAGSIGRVEFVRLGATESRLIQATLIAD